MGAYVGEEEGELQLHTSGHRVQTCAACRACACTTMAEQPSDEQPSDELGASEDSYVGELHTDNKILRENFEQLKQLHLTLSNSHKELQAQYEGLYQERLSVEQEYKVMTLSKQSAVVCSLYTLLLAVHGN